MNEKNVRKRFINLPIAYATISISGWIYYYLAEAITLFISKIYFDITIKNILLVSSMYIILECLFSFTLGFFIMETLHRKIFLPRFFPDGKIAATFYFAVEADPTYAKINGSWLNDFPYGVVHRIASDGVTKGAGTFCLNWVMGKINNIKIQNIRNESCS